MRERLSTIGALAVGIAAVAIVLCLAAVAGARGRDQFGSGSAQDVITALQGHGLAICDAGAGDSGRGEGGALSTREIEAGRPGDCADTIVVQLDAFADVSHRDAAAREAEARLRPRAAGTVFTWQQFTIYLQADEASGHPAVRDGIVAALDSIGAR